MRVSERKRTRTAGEREREKERSSTLSVTKVLKVNSINLQHRQDPPSFPSRCLPAFSHIIHELVQPLIPRRPRPDPFAEYPKWHRQGADRQEARSQHIEHCRRRRQSVSQSVEHEEHEQSRGEAGNKKEEVTNIPASAPSSANHVLTKYVNPNVTRLRLEEEAEGQQHCLSFCRRSALRGLMMTSRTH